VSVDRHPETAENHSQYAKKVTVGDDGDGHFPYNSLPLREEIEEGGAEREGEAQKDKVRQTPSPPSLRPPLDLFGGEL
jgi:hypothetical protein